MITSVRLVRAYYFRLLLVGLRWIVPVMTIFANTVIFYTFFAAVFSVLTALVTTGVPRVVEWPHVALTFGDTVDRFATRMMAPLDGAERAPGETRSAAATRQRTALQACEQRARVRAEQHEALRRLAVPGHAYAPEATAKEWQEFSRVWNAIVDELHCSDLLSSAERTALLFEPMRESDAFFGVPEYLILPTAFTSAVFLSLIHI